MRRMGARNFAYPPGAVKGRGVDASPSDTSQGDGRPHGSFAALLAQRVSAAGLWLEPLGAVKQGHASAS
jgi:hypothetical protein